MIARSTLRTAAILLALGLTICWSARAAHAQAQPGKAAQPAKGDAAAGAKAPLAKSGEPKSNLIRSMIKMLDDEGAASAEEKQKVRDMLMEADDELARSGGANLVRTIMEANKRPAGIRIGGTKSRRRTPEEGAAPKKPAEGVKPSTEVKPVAPTTPMPKPTAPPMKKTPEVEDPFAVPVK